MFRRIIIFLSTCLIIILSLADFNSSNNLQIKVPYLDKIIHFMMYFFYSFLLLYKPFKDKKIRIVLKLSISLVLGIILEFIQFYLLSYRSGEVTDVIFNTAGTFTGLLLYLILQRN